MKRRLSLPGIAIGTLVDCVSNTLLSYLVIYYAMVTAPISAGSAGGGVDVAVAAMQAHPALIALRLGVGIVCSLAGGFVAARIAKHDEILNGGLSGAVKFVYGSITVVASLGDPPGTLLLEVLVIIMCLYASVGGAYLSKRLRPPIEPVVA